MEIRAVRLATLVTLALLPTAPLAAQAERPWVHIEVSEDGQPKANVNLPLSVVQAAVELAPEQLVTEGRLKLSNSDRDISVTALRRMWQDLRDAGDAELVTVREDDKTVSISRKGNLILILVEESETEEQVRVEVPVSVVDALLEGEGETLNVRGALEELGRQRGEMVRVQDGDNSIRIWIDETP